MSLSAEAEPPSIADTNAVPTLRANFSWTLAGNVFYGACQWGMLSALAKLGNASIVGEFTLGLAISSPIFVFTNLQLRSVQATDTQLECRFADYFPNCAPWLQRLDSVSSSCYCLFRRVRGRCVSLFSWFRFQNVLNA